MWGVCGRRRAGRGQAQSLPRGRGSRQAQHQVGEPERQQPAGTSRHRQAAPSGSRQADTPPPPTHPPSHTHPPTHTHKARTSSVNLRMPLRRMASTWSPLTSSGCRVTRSHSSSHSWCLLLPSRERKPSSFTTSARRCSQVCGGRVAGGWVGGGQGGVPGGLVPGEASRQGRAGAAQAPLLLPAAVRGACGCAPVPPPPTAA